MRPPLSRLALAGFLILASKAAAQGARPADFVRDTTLANGLQVIVARNPAIPFVTVEMAFRAGAFIQQQPGYEGLPHLIEHLLFRSDGGAFADDAEKISATWNGVTSTESVRYFFSFPSKHLVKGMEIMSRLVRKPDFSKSSIEVERKVVQGELERHASDPEALLLTDADLQLWGDAGLTVKNPGGNLVALNGATPDSLKGLYERFYVPNNAALIVAGDVSDSVVFALAAKTFAGWKRGADPLASLKPSPIVPLRAIQRKIVTADVKDVTFLVRWQGPSVRQDVAATHAADVFSGLVNQRVSASQKRLVDRGIFDDVSLSYETLNNTGPIALYARTSPDRAVEAAEALGDELGRLVAQDYFDAEDLRLAKKWEEVSSIAAIERAESAAHTIAAFWCSADLAYYMAYDERMGAQTGDDVHSFVSKYIAGKPMAVTVRLPNEAWTQFGVPLQRALGAWRVP